MNGVTDLERGRTRYLAQAWGIAFDSLARADRNEPLGAEDLEMLARSAYMLGRTTSTSSASSAPITKRLRGEFEAAEEAYRQASLHGCEPQPGLALMRLAQGNEESAAAAIRRFAGETTVPLRRAGILPAYVEIMLAVGSHDLARAACGELEETAKHFDCEALDAMAAHSRGTTALAEGRASDALIELRRALAIWTELDAPYEIARVRLLIGLACRALEDHDTAALELEAARAAFHHLGAATDEARAASLAAPVGAKTEVAGTHGLTGRELQVLRLIAAGKSNREIADALFISEHTVARHVQNIFAKLSVSSRSAATAFAFSHQLV